MHNWKKINTYKNILYIMIMTFFASSICIDLSVKLNTQNKKELKSKIVATNLCGLIGFSLLLYHHYSNTLWKEGFFIILFMLLLLLYSTYKSLSI